MKQPAESLQIEGDVLFLSFIHQINTDDDIGGHLENLKDEIQVSLQCGRIADDDCHRRLVKADEFAGDRFFRTVGDQRIRSRQIDQRVVLIAITRHPFGQGDRFSRPVAGMLLHAGQFIEYRTFSDIGIAGQGYQNFRIRKAEAAAGFRAGRLYSESHIYSSSCSTRMERESLSRMAMTVPRIR